MMNVNHIIRFTTITLVLLSSLAQGDQTDHSSKSPFVLEPHFARKKTPSVMTDIILVIGPGINDM